MNSKSYVYTNSQQEQTNDLVKIFDRMGNLTYVYETMQQYGS